MSYRRASNHFMAAVNKAKDISIHHGTDSLLFIKAMSDVTAADKDMRAYNMKVLPPLKRWSIVKAIIYLSICSFVIYKILYIFL